MVATQSEQEFVDKFKADSKMRRELVRLCKEFIADNNICCADTIYQSDRIIEKAYYFIENICDVVGYAE